jgi:1-acyl-sn-glycerol-3-phosphate acyltransferase
VLFPEGERKSGPTVQPLFDGATYIAMKAGVPIIPVGIGGSERAMPKGAKFIWPRKVHVVVGAPIPVPFSENGRVTREARQAMSGQLHAELQRLFEQAEARVSR